MLVSVDKIIKIGSEGNFKGEQGGMTHLELSDSDTSNSINSSPVHKVPTLNFPKNGSSPSLTEGSISSLDSEEEHRKFLKFTNLETIIDEPQTVKSVSLIRVNF